MYYSTRFLPNPLSLRSGERARERGAWNRLRDFPSPRPSPHSFVAGRGRRYSVKTALFVLSSILRTTH